MASLVAATHTAVSAGIGEYFERYRRHVYVTPKSYLSFLSDYQTTYAAKHAAKRPHIGTEEILATIQTHIAARTVWAHAHTQQCSQA